MTDYAVWAIGNLVLGAVALCKYLRRVQPRSAPISPASDSH